MHILGNWLISEWASDEPVQHDRQLRIFVHIGVQVFHSDFLQITLHTFTRTSVSSVITLDSQCYDVVRFILRHILGLIIIIIIKSQRHDNVIV